MNFFEKLKSKAIIQDTADHFRVSPEDVLRDIQTMIDDAWASSDPAAQKDRSLQKSTFFQHSQP